MPKNFAERNRRIRGFSLLEMSMVLIIIATLTGIGISAGSSAIEAARITQTNQKLAQIKRALFVFRTSYNRIPCPASLTLRTTAANFGVQGPQSTNCIIGTANAATANRVNSTGTVVEGAVPTKTLNLPDDFAFDGWGNRIRYITNTEYVQNEAFKSIPLNDSCPATQVLDGTGPTNFRTRTAAYALVSSGANGHGAYTRAGVIKNSGSTNADELEDCDCDATGALGTFNGVVVQQAIERNPNDATDAFDDIVEYQTRWQMQTNTEAIEAYNSNTLAIAHQSFPYLTVYDFTSCTFTKYSDAATMPGGTGYGVDFVPGTNNIVWGGLRDASTRIGFLFSAASNALTFQSVYENSAPANYVYPTGMEVSHNGDYIAYAMECCTNAPGIVRVYKRTAPTTYSSAGISFVPAPGGGPNGNYWRADASWSPDDATLYVLFQKISDPWLDVYSRSGDTFTLISSLDMRLFGLGTSSGLICLAVHPSGRYIAVCTQGMTAGYNGPIVIKDPNGALGTPTALNQSGSGLTAGLVTGADWSPDGNYLAVSRYNGQSVYKFDQAAALAGTPPYFTSITVSGTTCPTITTGASWSKDGRFLAIGSSAPPYICVFRKSGDRMTRIADPTDPPAGSVIRATGVAWSR